MNDHTAAVQVVERLRQRAEAAEQRADRLAAVLREYGETDDFGRWHEFGCVEDFTDFETGEPLSRCSRARAALADSPKEMSPQRPRHLVADVLTDDMIRAALADSPKEETR